MAFIHSARFWYTVFILAALSSFTIVVAEENSKAEEQQTDAKNTASQEDNKDKRSQEEFSFGNQQNTQNGLVDDLMNMSENTEDNSNGSQAQDSKLEIGSEETRQSAAIQDNSQNDMMMNSGYSDWDNIAPGYQNSLPMVDLVNSLYDQKDVYQPMRHRLERPIPLRKRSLRSSLGQMIQKRGIRMPRRSMRLKRQVDVEDLLNLFENERFYNEDAQVTPHSFSGRARTVAKRRVPGQYNGYSETPEYPYIFQHKMAPEDIDDLLLLPPPQDGESYGSQEDKNEEIQRWLNRHTVPSVFRVSKRASPFFYPIDYRYFPTSGFKKRSNRNGHVGRHFDDETEGGDFGQWGHVVQVPEAYASPEDIARLYGLANLLSEGEEVRKRRSI